MPIFWLGIKIWCPIWIFCLFLKVTNFEVVHFLWSKHALTRQVYIWNMENKLWYSWFLQVFLIYKNSWQDICSVSCWSCCLGLGNMGLGSSAGGHLGVCTPRFTVGLFWTSAPSASQLPDSDRSFQVSGKGRMNAQAQNAYHKAGPTFFSGNPFIIMNLCLAGKGCINYVGNPGIGYVRGVFVKSIAISHFF